MGRSATFASWFDACRDEPRLIGRRFADNAQLSGAVAGRTTVNLEIGEKKGENVYERDEPQLVEVYVPIVFPENPRVVGVVETYKEPTHVFANIRRGQMTVVATALAGGALLYLSLFWIVRRAGRRIDAQHHALELQSRDVLAANEELRAVQAQLIEAERMAAIGEVVASVAHGIRNSLANIRASAEVALLDCKDCDRAAVGPRSLANIMAEVDRLAVRLKELLQFVRPTERRSQPVDLNTVLQRALELLAGRIAEAHVRLEHWLAPARPVISGDPMILEQIFVNLVGNAVEAMSADGGIITLTTGAGRSRRSSTSSTRPRRKGRAWAWPSPRSSPKPTVARSPCAVAPGMARPSVSRFRAGRRLSLIGPARPGSPSVFHSRLLRSHAPGGIVGATGLPELAPMLFEAIAQRLDRDVAPRRPDGTVSACDAGVRRAPGSGQLDLQLGRHGADLVQKQRAPGRRLEEPGLRRAGDSTPRCPAARPPQCLVRVGERWRGRRGCANPPLTHASLRHAGQASRAMTPPRQPGRAGPGPSQGALSGLRWWPFVILAGAGAVVFLSGGRQGAVTGPLTMVWALTLAMGLALAVFLEVVARTCVARRRLAAGFDASPEAARAILDASAGLTRVVSLAISVFMSLLALPQTWLPGTGQRRALGLGTAALLGAIVWSVWSLRSVYRRLEQAGQLGGLEGWNGFVYSNPKDPRLWVPKLSGFGATLNFAHARAWLVLAAILALPLAGLAVALVSAFCR